MTEECGKCHKPGTPYYARITGKGGKISYHKYVKHTEATGRKGQTLQTTCYIGPVGEEEYNMRPQRAAKRIIESTGGRFEEAKESWLEYRKELQPMISQRKNVRPGGVIKRLDDIFGL